MTGAEFTSRVKVVSETALGKVKTAASLKAVLAQYAVIAAEALSSGVTVAEVTELLQSEQARLMEGV